MPAYRKRRRRATRSKPWYDKKYSTADLALKAFKGVKRIRKLINVERKVSDTVSTTAMSTTPVVLSLNQILQGDGPEQREGNSIKPQSLLVSASSHPSASAGSTECRLLIVRDLQQVADTSPALLDVLDSVDIISMRNEANRGRFNILFDSKWSTNNTAMDTKVISTSMPMHGHIRFNGSAITDIQKNGLYVMYFSNHASLVPTMDFKARLYYTDN